MAKATLNKSGIATKAGDMTVYNFDGKTREYLSASVEFLAVGVGIPAYSSIDAPGEKKDGFAICRTADSTDWEYVPDHRGETVYSTETGEAVIISTPGDYPEGTTTLAHSTPYDIWNGSEWVTDTKAQHAADIAAAEQKKTAMLVFANQNISPLQDAIDLDIATEEEKAALLAWKKHRVLLNRVDTDKAPDIDWPQPPQS